MLAAIAASTAGAFLVWSGAHVRPFIVSLTALVAVASVWLAARVWLRVAAEYKRYSADEAERKGLLADRQAAFDLWKEKLANRPDDLEMARLLECDRKTLMEQAMDLYRLKRQDILAHAFLGNTLHVLEGVAAEGKEWLSFESQREKVPSRR